MRKENLKQIVFDDVLPRVRKPGQYTGGERNTIVKNHADVDVKVALAFPDAYTVGMSHLGLKILYHMLNLRDDVAAERVFAPWTDLEDELRRRGLPLYSLETFTPIGEFDVIGFSLQYELCYTNILNMLELAGVPRLTEERSAGDPVVLGGGSISMAAEPVAPPATSESLEAGPSVDMLTEQIAPALRVELHETLEKIAWESFGLGWVTDVVKQLKLDDARVLKADIALLLAYQITGDLALPAAVKKNIEKARFEQESVEEVAILHGAFFVQEQLDYVYLAYDRVEVTLFQ